MELLLGFLIALAVGLTGVGGGTLTTPILILGFGVPAVEAVGTSLVFVTVAKFAAAPVYALRGQVSKSATAKLLAGGIPGVVAGSLILSRLNTRTLEPLVLAIVGSTVVIMSALHLYKMRRHAVRAPGTPREHWLPRLAFFIGVEIGFSSAGAGALGSLALMECTSLPAAMIVGTDLLFGLAISAVGGAIHASLGNVSTSLVVPLCVGGVAGALAGASIGTRVPARPLRVGLAWMLVFIGGQLCFKAFHALAR